MVLLTLVCFQFLTFIVINGYTGFLNDNSVLSLTQNCHVPDEVEQRVYDFTLPDILLTKNISLSQYRNKVLLVVNVATYCGFTWNYLQLNELKIKYKFQDFEILGFPCNQFLKQEPGGNGTEILNGIKYVRPGNEFVPNFPLFSKIEVNGYNEQPLYSFIKAYCPPTRERFANQENLYYSPMRIHDVRWNFEKYLIDRNGKPVKRYDPTIEPLYIAQDIESLLLDGDWSGYGSS